MSSIMLYDDMQLRVLQVEIMIPSMKYVMFMDRYRERERSQCNIGPNEINLQKRRPPLLVSSATTSHTNELPAGSTSDSERPAQIDTMIIITFPSIRWTAYYGAKGPEDIPSAMDVTAGEIESNVLMLKNGVKIPGTAVEYSESQNGTGSLLSKSVEQKELDAGGLAVGVWQRFLDATKQNPAATESRVQGLTGVFHKNIAPQAPRRNRKKKDVRPLPGPQIKKEYESKVWDLIPAVESNRRIAIMTVEWAKVKGAADSVFGEYRIISDSALQKMAARLRATWAKKHVGKPKRGH